MNRILSLFETGKVKRILGAAIALILFASMLVFERQGGIKHLLLGFTLSAGCGLLINLKKFPLIPSLLVLAAYMIYAPYKLLIRMELPVNDLSSLQKESLWLGLVMVYLLYIICFLFTQRIGSAVACGNVILLLITVSEYYLVTLRGKAFSFYDLSVFTDYNRGEASILPSRELCYSVVWFAFFILLAAKLDISPQAIKEKFASYLERPVHIIASIAGVLLNASFFFVLLFTPFLENHGFNDLQRMETPLSSVHGLLLYPFVEYRSEQGEGAKGKTDWLDYRGICHALGITETGDVGTNSLEAFLYNYRRGHRVFEADIQITSDGVYVLRHDWDMDLGQGNAFGWTEEDKKIPTMQKFMEAPILEKYTPLTLADWFGLMKKYPDVWFVTDSKYSGTVSEDFKLFVDTAKECGCEDVLSRVIVQLYYPVMYEAVNSVYPFENYILTIYYMGYPEDTTDFYELLERDNLKGLTMPKAQSEKKLPEVNASSDFKLYLHTVDDATEASELFKYAYGLYTDSLTEKDLEKAASTR
ncbi:MAG: hypothetical protein K6E19_08900 [Lachnospiraceae bacterium]|nr:hypothetical protein [Lachnospiraceae bacterium]